MLPARAKNDLKSPFHFHLFRKSLQLAGRFPSPFHDVKQNVFLSFSIPISFLFLFRAVHDDNFNQT